MNKKLIPKHQIGGALKKLVFGLSQHNPFATKLIQNPKLIFNLSNLKKPIGKAGWETSEIDALNRLQRTIEEKPSMSLHDITQLLKQDEILGNLSHGEQMNLQKQLIAQLNSKDTKNIRDLAVLLSKKTNTPVSQNIKKAQELLNDPHGLPADFIKQYPQVLDIVQPDKIAGYTAMNIPQYSGYLTNFFEKNPELLDNPEFMSTIKQWYQQVHPNFMRGTPKKEMLDWYSRIKDTHGVHEQLGRDFSADSIKLLLKQFLKGQKKAPKLYEVVPGENVIALNRLGNVQFGKGNEALQRRIYQLKNLPNSPFVDWTITGSSASPIAQVMDSPLVPNTINPQKSSMRHLFNYETWKTPEEHIQEINPLLQQISDNLVAQGKNPLKTFDNGSFIRFNPKTNDFELFGMDLFKHKKGGTIQTRVNKLFRKQ